MKRRQNFQTISWFYDLYKRDRLNLDPPYQRRSVWNQVYKEFFIDTIILDFPAPAIFIYEEIDDEGIATYNIVDGKQRLITIFSFIDNEFAVSKISEQNDLRETYFTDFSKDIKSAFWSYTFSVEYLPTSNLSVITNVFNRINKNVAKLTAQELRHAKFSGDFITSVENNTDRLFAISKNFPRIAPQSMREMKDYEFVSQLFLLLEEGPKGYSSDELDKEFSARESDWERKSDIIEKYEKIIGHLNELVGIDTEEVISKSRLRNQADFYSLFGALNRLVDEGHQFDYNHAKQKLIDFITRVENEGERSQHSDENTYFEHARTASNRTTARKERENILVRVIKG
jgi:hypothetical protein